MTPNEITKRTVEIIRSFDDFDDAGEVLVVLTNAIQAVVAMSAHDKRDALATMAWITKDLRSEMKRDYESIMQVHRSGLQ